MEDKGPIKLKDMVGKTYKWSARIGSTSMQTEAILRVDRHGNGLFIGIARDTDGETRAFIMPQGIFIDMWRVGLLQEVEGGE